MIKLIESDEEYEKKYNRPKTRLKEISAIRIYQDKDIGNILQLITEMKQEIIGLKRQISAHDYNISGRL